MIGKDKVDYDNNSNMFLMMMSYIKEKLVKRYVNIFSRWPLITVQDLLWTHRKENIQNKQVLYFDFDLIFMGQFSFENKF